VTTVDERPGTAPITRGVVILSHVIEQAKTEASLARILERYPVLDVLRLLQAGDETGRGMDL
jgi:hypothetical protein